MGELEVSTKEDRGVAIVTVDGDVDVSNATRLRDTLDHVLATGRAHVVVDVRGVPFMDSTGLGVLVGRMKVVRARRGSIRLVVTAPRMLRVLSITGLDTVFPLYDTPEDAVASFGVSASA
ncbi:Anti-sigma-B factor antagonist [Austwickia sp. TVS 96-490-7B]|uniref:STAS domain-containing protein n=1 Tax=Austwickia sp. TVS 96-490-7B TaxID=2830843 RepID=UPI001C55B5DD|nr:STAS domain-containing protein [Austwickia sp. TVS 96-490-7B]MBW3084893.1 Anti-sigma-B factor antagonist [Austwickia sp. TVS 96-490-7B]